ncbi:metallophosphoesterase family protein [Shimazuella kribbensis]|uniref:metallophosphoesterase family protein n=1 Tax=Shimazuella kribbensis TaxID=139808 RepID=UPI00041922BF|nr:DNA repair exonuclease [Shimazuella kribbensis]
MHTISFVHIADLHLGEPIKGWKWDKERVWIRQEEHQQTFKRIITYVKENAIPFLLIAGDFLEHGFVTSVLYQFVLEQLQRIPDTRIFISPGNHDPYREDSVYQQETWPENVYIFSDSWETLYFPEYHLHISGRGFGDFSDRKNSLPIPILDANYHIYLVHGDFKEEQSIYFPIIEKDLSEHDVDYVALGHIHKRQTYLLKNRKGTIIHYPGTPEARSWKETGVRFLTHGTIDEKGVSLEKVPISTRKYEQIKINITNQLSLNQISEVVSSVIREFDTNDYLAIQLVGRSAFGTEDKNWLIKLEKMLPIEHKWLFIEDLTLLGYDLKKLKTEQNFVGTFVQLMETRIAQETDQKKKRILQQALYRGLDAMEKEVVMQ